MHPQPRPARLSGLLGLVALATLGCHTPGTAQHADPEPQFAPEGQSFDLVIYGHDLDPGEHEILLRTNLDFGGEYVSMGTIDVHEADERWISAVFPDLSARRFLGHDFREMYIDVRIVTADAADGGRLTAIYALPHVDGLASHVHRLTRLIEQQPQRVEAASLASHVQPSPAELAPGTAVVQHVRVPMKHRQPGVAEVEQLQVEWRNRGG